MAGVLALTGCASGSATAAPTWVPQPPYTLEPNPIQPGAPPIGSAAPGPTGSNSSDSSSTGPNPTGPSASPSPASDPLVVAKNLSAPTGIAVLPDGTALVGQRTTGVIVRVQPTAGKPVTTVRTIAGLDPRGDGGLLDLAISPTYSQDHLIYAYVTTATDNRVIDFTLTGPATPVFVGIPKAATGNAGRIAFGADGTLLIGTGDAGQSALAQNPASLAGKVLEVSDVGAPLSATGPVLTTGHHNLAGLCVDGDTGSIFETEVGDRNALPSAAGADEINLLTKGADYGWPTTRPSSEQPATALPNGPDGARAIAAGCAVADSVLYVASLDGTALYAATIASTGATPTISIRDFATPPALTGAYGRLVTVVAAADGTLWLATTNEGVSPAPHGAKPTDDDRILHIPAPGGGAGSQA
jgi:glucose/arabinose dehydrogenase